MTVRSIRACWLSLSRETRQPSFFTVLQRIKITIKLIKVSKTKILCSEKKKSKLKALIWSSRTNNLIKRWTQERQRRAHETSCCKTRVKSNSSEKLAS